MRDLKKKKKQKLYINGPYVLSKLIPVFLCPNNLILSVIVADNVHQVIPGYTLPETFLNYKECKKIG